MFVPWTLASMVSPPMAIGLSDRDGCSPYHTSSGRGCPSGFRGRIARKSLQTGAGRVLSISYLPPRQDAPCPAWEPTQDTRNPRPPTTAPCCPQGELDRS